MFHHGLLESHGDEGAAVDAVAELPSYFAFRSESAGKAVAIHGGNRPDAVHLILEARGDGEEVYGVRGEEGFCPDGHSSGAVGLAFCGGHVGRDLTATQADPGLQTQGTRHCSTRALRWGMRTQARPMPSLTSIPCLRTIEREGIENYYSFINS